MKIQWNTLTLPPLNLWNIPKVNNQVRHHYTEMGNVPVVVCYEYIRSLRVYDADKGNFTLIPAVIRIHEIYIDGLSCKGVKSFSDWQLDKWEQEIDNVESPVKPFVQLDEKQIP